MTSWDAGSMRPSCLHPSSPSISWSSWATWPISGSRAMPEKAPLTELEKALEHKKTILLAFLVTTMAHLLWLGGILLAPYLRSRSSPWSGLAYAVYSPVCHQVAGRSLRCFGEPLAVCTRCTGIYLGFLLGLGLYPFLRGWRRLSLPAPRIFFFVSGPIVLDT